MAEPTKDQGKSEQEKRAAEAAAAKKAEQAAAKKAADDAKKQKAKDEAAAKKADTSKVKYFKSRSAAGLTILKEDGSTVRFTARFDEWKGDKVRVGFLATDDKEVIARCEADPSVVEVKEDEYKESEELELAPVYSV